MEIDKKEERTAGMVALACPWFAGMDDAQKTPPVFRIELASVGIGDDVADFFCSFTLLQ